MIISDFQHLRFRNWIYIYSWLYISTVSGLDQAGLANPMKEIESIPKCSGSKTWDGQPRRKNALNFGEFYFLLVS